MEEEDKKETMMIAQEVAVEEEEMEEATLMEETVEEASVGNSKILAGVSLETDANFLMNLVAVEEVVKDTEEVMMVVDQEAEVEEVEEVSPRDLPHQPSLQEDKFQSSLTTTNSK